ncbi:XRE family transcriptional regulator [Streptomyces niveus]|uniref:XRE family transcriptional regulator n=1 Tax=Streptomyces niveus TaxID=193462 RepID=UPI0036545DE3
MSGNVRLSHALRETGFTQAELADAVNTYLWDRGHAGTVSDRTVRNWLTGKTRWPHPRQREALTALFGRSAGELGFIAPECRPGEKNEGEDPVRRRDFVAATAGTAVGAPLVTARPSMAGSGDVSRLRAGLSDLVHLDQSRGGHGELERQALTGAERTLEMCGQAATQRIRQRLYAIAADYTAIAGWSALDAHRLDHAQSHMARALRLAGMAQDPTALFQVWNMYAILCAQRQDFHQAADAADAAQATAVTRRDPMFASLAHARAAINHAGLGERQPALRALGRAEDALGKALRTDPSRPNWIAFYGPGELSAITAVVRNGIGDAPRAEAASHEALARIPAPFRRNRALATVQLALGQLGQGDVEQACGTADMVFVLMAGDTLPGRLRSRLDRFQRALTTSAPGANASRQWSDRYRVERGSA